MNKIFHKGNSIRNIENYPSWLNERTNGQFQFWHHKSMASFVEHALEIIYPYEDNRFQKVDNCYRLDLDRLLAARGKLLVMPHPDSPLQCIPAVWEINWWHLPISLFFKEINVSLVKKNMILSYAFLINYNELEIVEEEIKSKRIEWINNYKYSGNNLYNHLACLYEGGKIPKEKIPKRIVNSKNVSLGKNKKENS